MVILIAGGTGLIGEALSDFWKKKGHEVRILTRKATDRSKGLYQWDLKKGLIDEQALKNLDVVVNLTGAGIADKKWTAARKKELIDSRVDAAKVVAKYGPKMPQLKQYISASGINCYGYNQPERLHVETDPFGTDFLSQVVEQWEAAADLMKPLGPVAKIRISVVLTHKGGTVPKIAKTIKNYIGAPLGTGKQAMPWISLTDLVRVFDHVLTHKLEGAYNAVAGNPTNAEFTKALAKSLNKPLLLPNVPAFVLKLLLGEMSTVLLDGLKANNSKLVATGFELEEKELEEVF